MDGIVLRGTKESDYNLIYNSFLMSYRGSFPVWHLENKIYFSIYHKIMESCIKKLGGFVACVDEDPDAIVGWIIGNPDRVAYVFVKPLFRRLGVGRTLLAAALRSNKSFDCVFPTRDGLKLCKGAGVVPVCCSAKG